MNYGTATNLLWDLVSDCTPQSLSVPFRDNNGTHILG